MNQTELALNYLSPRKNNFWHWSIDGQTIELGSDYTICFRKELVELLSDIKMIGLPSLEAIVFFILACKDQLGRLSFHFESDETLQEQISANETDENYDALINAKEDNHVIKYILPLLGKISRLPVELRSGHMRSHLLKEILKQSTELTPPPLANFLINEIASERLRSGRLNNYVASPPKTLVEILHIFKPLKDIDDLESLLRTGLEHLPEPAPLPQPDPIPSQDDLLTQLAQDQQTAGLARLTKRLIAALNIPPHTQGASDQPLGGVSDISNRGDFDRLLLSELANDDDTLSARLVNNEALYLRRETPPDPQVQERVILVDTSLRLWGMPRVFAVSAALGCALNNHQKAGISAFALGKELIGPNALAKKEDIIQFLEQQSPVLHSGEALRAFFRQQPRSAQRAVFFITSEEVMADKNFSLIFAEQQQHLDYLLVLSRTGTLWFYKLVNGQRSLMSTSVFDLEELLFDQKKSAMLAALVGALGLQAEHSIKHDGLFLPSYPGKLRRDDVAFDGTVLVAVLPSKRVWFWHSAQKGAVEVLDKIEDGGYSFYLVDHELKCIVVSTRDYKFMAYLFENNQLSAVVDLYAKLMRHLPYQNVIKLKEIDGQVVACGYEEGNLFIGLNLPGNPTYAYHYKNITHVIDLKTNAISLLPEKRFIPKEHSPLNLQPIKKMVNNGYSVLRNVREIGFTTDGFIQLGDHRIILKNDKLWLVQASKAGVPMTKFRSQSTLDDQFYTRTFEWKNGCKITLDSRGFLSFNHTKRYNNFQITLIIGQELAAWSTREHYTGNPYFYTLANEGSVVTPTHFYKRFILVFINEIGKP